MTGKSQRVKYMGRRGKMSDEPSMQNLFIACLPREVTNAMLLQLFDPFNAATATVMLHVATGKSKGFGFVTFHDDADGAAALHYYTEREVFLDGVPSPFVMHISPSRFNGKSIVTESQYAFFRNIPTSLNKQEIRHALSPYGQVLHIQQREDEHCDDGSLMLLMIEFASIDDARCAIEQCHSKILFPHLSNVPVLAKFADISAVKAQLRKRSRSLSLSPTARSLAPTSAASTPQQPCLSLDSYQMPRCFSNTNNSESDEAGLSDFDLYEVNSRRVSLVSEGRRTSAGLSADWNSSRRFSSSSNGSRPDSRCWFRNDPYREDQAYVVVETPAAFEQRSPSALNSPVSTSILLAPSATAQMLEVSPA